MCDYYKKAEKYKIGKNKSRDIKIKEKYQTISKDLEKILKKF